jgi:hypothetical protein
MTSVTHPCPECGKAASGNFCQHCGASLGGRFCDQCGAKADKGARFCTQCGAPLGAASAPAGPPVVGARAGAARPSGAVQAPRRGGASRTQPPAPGGGMSGNLPWWIAGVSMFGLILAVGINMVRPGTPAAPTPAGPGGAANPAAGTSSLDLSTMSPREAADRLFNRVMTTISQGDTAGALAFQPMAVQAYELIADLDLDGLVHRALLELLASPEQAMATAEEILAVEPDHVLGLGIAADAAVRMGDDARAEELYRHVMRVYDEQAARSLVEYDTHRTVMADVRATAEAFLAGR